MPGASDLGSGIGGGLGSILGYFLSQGDRDSAMGAIQQAAGKYNNLDPRILAQEMGPSAYGSIRADPALRAAQLQALNQLQRVYQSGGMDPQAKAEMFAAQQSGNQNAQALNGAIASQAAQRGVGGAGATYAAQRQNAQNAANSAQMQGLQALAQGYQRQMGALNSAANIASGTRGQDYGQASDAAAAQDAIARFNAGQRQGAAQQTFNNGYQQDTGEAQGLYSEAGAYNDRAKQTQQLANGIGQFAGGVAGMAAGGM